MASKVTTNYLSCRQMLAQQDEVARARFEKGPRKRISNAGENKHNLHSKWWRISQLHERDTLNVEREEACSLVSPPNPALRAHSALRSYWRMHDISPHPLRRQVR
jgi:hypothetical protein